MMMSPGCFVSQFNDLALVRDEATGVALRKWERPNRYGKHAHSCKH